MANTFTGKVWKFGDDINTDLVIPNFAVLMTVEEQLPHCFSANRPGWVDEVQPGDVLVAGRNFGVGSARNIGAVFHGLGHQRRRRRVVQRARPAQLHQLGTAVACRARESSTRSTRATSPEVDWTAGDVKNVDEGHDIGRAIRSRRRCRTSCTPVVSRTCCGTRATSRSASDVKGRFT